MLDLDSILKLVPKAKLIGSDSKLLSFKRISIPLEEEDGSIVFISDNKFLKKIINSKFKTKILLIITSSLYQQKKELLLDFTNILSVESIANSMSILSKYFFDQKFSHINFQLDGRKNLSAQISPHADIAPNVFIGENVIIEEECKIHSGAIIMPEVKVGKGSEIFSNVVIYPFTEIGQRVRIHANTTIGSDGFGYNFSEGRHQKVWHMAGVRIESDVEIGANSAVDMGAFTPTVIGEGTKIDNFCQIAHNSKIGKHCIMCGKSGVAGSCTLEDYVILGASAGVAPGTYLKKGTKLAGGTKTSDNSIWGPDVILAGHPAREYNDYMKTQARLNMMVKRESGK